MATIHDSGYKLLFSNRTIFRQLMESFVDQLWVAQLDFARAERVDKSFIDEAYQERESDLIYRIPLGEDEIYIYVLLEFQSTVDPLMALRVLNYVVSLYMELTRNQRSKKLPPIFPIVLYNGDDRWTAATDVADLIEPEPSLGEYGLHYRYLKLAENEFSQEALLKIGNIVSTLFLVEGHYDVDVLEAALSTVVDREEDRRALSLFIVWLYQMAQHGRISKEDHKRLEDVLLTNEEAQTMVAKTFDVLREKGREEGIEIGIEKGREVSRRETVLAMVARDFPLDLIADLFNLSVAEVEEIIARATTAQDNDANTSDNHKTS